MISWSNAKTEKPPINKDDAFDVEHKISKRVVVYYAGGGIKGHNVGFGTFHRKVEEWIVEGFRGQPNVLYFSEITDPYEGLESLASIILNHE